MKKSYLLGFVGLLLMLVGATVFASGIDGYVKFNHSNPMRAQKGQPAHIVVQYGNQDNVTLYDMRVKCQFLGRGNETFDSRTTAHQFSYTMNGAKRTMATETFTMIPGQNYNLQLVVVPPDYDDIRIRCRLQQVTDDGIVQVDANRISLKIH